jgi:hypothetical protein
VRIEFHGAGIVSALSYFTGVGHAPSCGINKCREPIVVDHGMPLTGVIGHSNYECRLAREIRIAITLGIAGPVFVRLTATNTLISLVKSSDRVIPFVAVDHGAGIRAAGRRAARLAGASHEKYRTEKRRPLGGHCVLRAVGRSSRMIQPLFRPAFLTTLRFAVESRQRSLQPH